MESVVLLGSIIGGLGLFLLAIGMMTDGLKLAAGNALRTLLAKWSKTPFRGVVSGAAMTALVQSSSAVTVASLGFVNAGLLSMRHALGIVYGANIGTTMTGWLVAMVGFKLNIQAVALPMIGVGMILKLLKPNSRLASVGIAIAGFGLFFVGIDSLKTAFEGIVSTFDLSQFKAEGVEGFLMYLVIGFVMTVLTQSSSASIALTITAATSGMVGIYAAGAMVIGANIGTTSTAMFASIGATSSAKRVAAAQVVFNVATAVVAALILPLLFGLIHWITAVAEIDADPGITLAIFHTLFNLLGVALIFPLNDRLARFLEQRFVSLEEEASKPKHLDKNIAQTPDLAVNALILELLSVSDRFLHVYPKLFSQQSSEITAVENDIHGVEALCQHISQFIVDVERAALSEETTKALASLMRVEHYMLSSAQKALAISALSRRRDVLTKAELEGQLLNYLSVTNEFMRMVRWRQFDSSDALSLQFDLLDKEHHKVKSALVMGATQGDIAVTQMTDATECMEYLLQIVQMWVKVFVRIQQVEDSITTANLIHGDSQNNSKTIEGA
ncbi:Na+/Picotransporter [Alteromonas macleodii str. 'Black Sea 11']|jgi:phosphate:Na+ symporter|nr:Na+/Picotransporter [Alteromonas macleodii str. 'Black Sea 11']NKW89429.1 Na/Pi cotransporter family protein [Alteromonadaceae bacterium A_SAG4]NKX05967.1 Na/Pi cotransporter family protein [Alteromonadaceae bacterium A_SAG6]NKX18881.1 Na/Pi cotransporter family protein [Alteromonadaceae bacterium A_SAG5]NKX19974.1 Na/Pi cotransporter family protein [Alteromonadaceae bacterium A_SAG8]NKX35247.1 Na/Pi cotransporter family protein [Alteromonadaceae bacterium A_SAG3]NKX69618.1 Na/Pi cotranspo